MKALDISVQKAARVPEIREFESPFTAVSKTLPPSQGQTVSFAVQNQIFGCALCPGEIVGNLQPQREIGFVLRKHPCLTQSGQTVYLDQGALIETVQRPYLCRKDGAGMGDARCQDKKIQQRPDSG